MAREKSGGRKKGVPNKLTLSHKKWLLSFIEQDKHKLEKEMGTLKGNDYVLAYLKICALVLAKPTEETKQADKTNPTIIKLADGTEITV